MKFLRIFGLFSLILSFAFNGAFAATDTGNPSEYGIYNDPVCDETGCTYCDDTQCYVCDTNMGECRGGCSNNQYGTGSINNGTVDCHPCPTAYPKSLLGTDNWSATFNLYEGQCFNISNCSGNVPSCNYVTDTQWQNYFGSTYGSFQPKLFIKDKIKFKMLNINSGCDVKTDYCTYELKRQKKGHIPVQFRNASGTIIDTYYVVYDAVWSTQDTSIDNSESSVIYPTFVTPTAPTISGKKFVGWYSAQTGGTQIITPASTGAYYGNLTRTNAGTTIDLSGNTKILYARYEDVAQPTWITITIDDKNNGTNPTTYSNPTVLYKNTNSAVSNCSGYKRTQSCAAASVTSITTPTLTGYTYGGHYTGTGGSGNQFISNSGVISTSYSPTSDITVFAKWTSDAYKISLNPTNAGSGITYTIYYNNNRFYCDNAGTTQINNGESIFTKCNFTKPTSNNGPFNGYWSEISGGVIYILEGGSFSTNLNNLNITGDMTWYAHYATCDSMIVLNPNGGNFSDTCANEFYPYYDSTTGQWMTPTLNTGCKPTLAGYTFMGYRVTNQNGVKYYDSNLNINIPVWGLCSQPKVELVAEWTGNCNEITFDDNNGMTSVNANNPQHKRTGSPDWWGVNATPSDPCGKIYEGTNPTVNVPSSDNVPAHATFLGYYTTRDTGGSMIFNTSGAATTYGTNTWIISAPTTLYARWQCDTNYVWNANTHTCEQNTASVTYKCYVDDSGQIDNGVTLTNYAVRSLSWYSACNINNNNPVPGYKWRFSGTNTDYNAGDIIPSWTYGNNQTFTPAYTATFNCNNDYWQTPTGGSAPAAQSVLLGGTLTMPNMPCEVKPEYDGWLETNYTWETSYTQNLTSPVPDAQCLISSSDLHYGPNDNFPWNCPTDLTFEPLTKFINKPITVSCGQGGTSQTFTMTFENQNEIEQDIINFFNSCGGSCPLDNPSGPHGYNRKVVCATGLENQNLPTTWEHIENDTQGRTCYKTPAGTNVQSILNEISLAQITDLNIYGISYCPQRVTYKCSEEATDVYNDAPYAVFEREYTTQTPETVGCESGLAFNNWKNPSDNQTFNAGATVDEWPYEDPVTLVAQWGGANTYTITYANMANATGSQTGMPTTYTYGTGATIDGVPTREHSIFIGWCTESTLANCAPTQTIPTNATGNKTFWANWECEHPYHIDPDTGACAVCDDDQYWDEEANSCSNCPTEFKHSKSGFNWSIDQCYRECPSNTLLGDANHRCDSNPNLWDMESCTVTSFEDFQNSTGKQIEFKGNSDAGIDTCNNPDNVYCPRGFMRCPSTQPYKPMTTRVDFHGGLDGQTLVGTRYIFGSRQGGEGLNIVNGKLWSSLDGPAQKVELNGSPNYYYTHIIYPAQTAPDATVQGYTFNGYYYPISDGTQYVGSDYGLNGQNAASVLNGQPGDYSQTRHLYATLENGGYTQNEYAITYSCGTGTGTTQTDTATYGENYTVKNNTDYTDCEKPGYSFLGWVFSGDSTMYNEGYVFRPWNYANDATFTAKWNDTGNTYTITYKPNYDGATEPDVTQSVTYGATFTTKPAGTFHRPGYEMTAWGSGSNQPNTPYPELAHTYTYVTASDVNLFAQWEMCTAGTYAGETETQCTDCPGEYPLSVAGASAIEQCYKNCSVPCTTVACPANSTCTQTNTMYNGTQYYGGTCDAVPQNCEITEIICDAGFFLNGTVCEPCPNGTTSPAGSTNENQCSACPDGQYVDNETCTDCPDGFDHSDANATSQSQCYHDCETPCTEPECPANSTSCTYGTNPNSGAWYFGTDACNATPLVCPIESVTCAGGYGWNPTNNTCEPCTGNEASINNSCEPCPDGTQPNADHTECVPCPDGTAGTNGTCEPCAPGYVPNAQATECVPCPAGTYWENGICEPCPEDYSSVPGSVGLDACFLAACPTGQHIAHGACEDDVIICDAPYAATATRTWNPTLGAYGSCQIQECEDGYHVASNACVPNDQLCNVANGRGERAWNGTQWGNCVVTECDPGFEPNASNTACGRCGNYMGADGQPAVSSYVTGCEIATCMYQGQKYALENSECRPICETASDDTGSKHWDNITKKCVRTCNPGYKMW